MGTRGILGLRINGVNKIAYNQFDSYPDGLGQATIAAIHTLLHREPSFHDRAEALRVVVEGIDIPSAADVTHLRTWTDLSVSQQSTTDWYCLLRKTQGNLAAMLDAGVIADASQFAVDGLFCEYGYLVNLDDRVLECYRGFEKSRHTKGRFAALSVVREDYYPIALVGTIPFHTIARSIDEAEAVLAQLYHEPGDDVADAEA